MRSLTSRLLVTATVVLLVFLGLTGSVLEQAFRSSAENSQMDRLRIQIYGLLAVAEKSPNGLYFPDELSEPGFNQPGSGLFALVSNTRGQEIWRSPSALDLMLNEDSRQQIVANITPGQSEFGQILDTQGSLFYFHSLGVLWQADGFAPASYVFTTIQHSQGVKNEIQSFRNSLWLWMGGAVGVLVLLQAAIMSWGLAPLRWVAEDLKAIESGKKDLLEGNYPTEIAGVTRNLNLLLSSERQQRERYKTTMADLAHSLKTPLAILKGVSGSRYLRDGRLVGRKGESEDDRDDQSQALRLSDRMDEVMATIDDQVDRMDQIISYQLQKAVSSSRDPIRRSVAVAPVLNSLVDALRKVYSDRGVQYELDVDESVFYGDERDLMELLGNLLDNASKYGHGTVSVRIHFDEQESRTYMSIEDNGPGIPESLRLRVLERGIRADSRESGQGIGLAVVADIVASYNGIIDIQHSRLGGALINVAI